ncbi:MAG: glycine zipper 2TM domain-containing protein [Candidatus Omnitrophota bacterium]
MRKCLVLFIFVSLLGLITGCESNKTRVAEGSVIGGVIGAAAGGIIGHQMGRGAEGAAIGAATGVGAGALIGAQIEKPGQKKEETSEQAATTAATATTAEATTADNAQLTVSQVVDMSKQGVSESIIIDKIRSTNSKFTLTQQDSDYLIKQGVSQKVIDVMRGK